MTKNQCKSITNQPTSTKNLLKTCFVLSAQILLKSDPIRVFSVQNIFFSKRMASRHPAYQQEDDIECLDDLTRTSSLPNIQVTVDNTEDEDDLWVIRMKLYNIKVEQLRYRLRKEYLEKYSIKEIIPKGLQSKKRIASVILVVFFSAQNIQFFKENGEPAICLQAGR